MTNHWGLDKPIVIAHDFGGAVTLHPRLLHGCALERYVLMNVDAMRSWGADFFNHLGKHVATFQGLPPNIHGAIVDNYFKGALVNGLSDTDFTALTTPWKTNEGTMSFYSQFAQANEKYTAEVEPVFGANRCPVQVVSGGR